MTDLVEAAKNILRKNDTGRMTVPSEHLYPHMWAWDSVFAAMGWAHIDLVRAEKELAYQLESAWENGMIPHIVFDPAHLEDYFPGPNVWGHPTSTSITQPPVWAMGLEYLIKQGLDNEIITAYLEQIEKTHQFFYKHRDPENMNLVAVCHPWESGMDNSPAWDIPLKQVSTESDIELARVDLEKVSDPSERPSNTEYRKYLRLVENLKTNNFTPTEFLTYDPFMSTILYLNELALDRLNQKFGLKSTARERAARIKDALISQFDAESGRFLYRDSLQKLNFKCSSLASLFPLLIDEIPNQMREKALETLKAEHLTNHGLTTQSLKDEKFDQVCYWRGPVWINTNFFFNALFKGELLEASEKLIREHGFREYYCPKDGTGLGATSFSWSAALYIVMKEGKL